MKLVGTRRRLHPETHQLEEERESLSFLLVELIPRERPLLSSPRPSKPLAHLALCSGQSQSTLERAYKLKKNQEGYVSKVRQTLLSHCVILVELSSSKPPSLLLLLLASPSSPSSILPLISSVPQAREKYHQECLRINSYTAQTSLSQGRELDKVASKLESAQRNIGANERDFGNFVKTLTVTTRQWESEWKGFCDVSRAFHLCERVCAGIREDVGRKERES